MGTRKYIASGSETCIGIVIVSDVVGTEVFLVDKMLTAQSEGAKSRSRFVKLMSL